MASARKPSEFEARGCQLVLSGGHNNGYDNILATPVPYSLRHVMAGTVFFTALFLEPRLKRLGPGIQNPVMNSLMPVVTPAMIVSSLIVIGTGVALALMVWGSLDTLFTTTSGWILLIGFLATLASAGVGFGVLAPTGMRLGKLNKSLEGREPSPEETSQLIKLNARIQTMSRTSFAFMVIAVGAMGFLRYL